MALGVAPTLDVRLFLLKLPVAGNSVLAKASEQQFHAGLAAFSERKITSSAGISIASHHNFIFAFYCCPCGQPSRPLHIITIKISVRTRQKPMIIVKPPHQTRIFHGDNH
ncbi:hypothetical protein GJU94_09295 [Brucella sp. 10RB9214]|nr:hypothetical protein BKD02_16855 [Brucella sp. 09RB8910]MRN47178.1 hypothetical protein [Brucella sp. 10RB9212]MRN50028.1 hypothetical protein [Brucella sp. 10RB9214]